MHVAKSFRSVVLIICKDSKTNANEIADYPKEDYIKLTSSKKKE